MTDNPGNEEAIEVEFITGEVPADFFGWVKYTRAKLIAAGVPLKDVDGSIYDLESGTLTRLDDPADFGKCKYVWTP